MSKDILSEIHRLTATANSLASAVGFDSDAFLATGNVVFAKRLRSLEERLEELARRLDSLAGDYVQEGMDAANESQKAINSYVNTVVKSVSEGKLRGPE